MGSAPPSDEVLGRSRRGGTGLDEVLEGKGWDSTLIKVPSADHPGILYEAATLDAVMDLATAPYEISLRRGRSA